MALSITEDIETPSSLQIKSEHTITVTEKLEQEETSIECLYYRSIAFTWGISSVVPIFTGLSYINNQMSLPTAIISTLFTVLFGNMTYAVSENKEIVISTMIILGVPIAAWMYYLEPANKIAGLTAFILSITSGAIFCIGTTCRNTQELIKVMEEEEDVSSIETNEDKETQNSV